MRSEYLGSKKLVDWLGVIMVLCVFLIDTALGNIYKLYAFEDQLTDAFRFCQFKEMFSLVPYILLVIISLNIRVRFDKFDMSILFVCLFLQILNCADYFISNNWRPQWSDWVIFGVITVPALILKYKTYER